MPASPAHRLRIIGGRFRGRVVRFPRATEVRPTPDRVRETLFNWLGQDLTGWKTLDPYAGSGVLTLEALSRGAELAVALDRNATLVASLSETARTFGAAGLEAHVGDARAWISRESRVFDAIFLDPPFDSDPWSWLLPACATRLAGAGYVYAEAPRELPPPPGLTIHRHARAGQVHYHLLQHSELPP